MICDYKNYFNLFTKCMDQNIALKYKYTIPLLQYILLYTLFYTILLYNIYYQRQQISVLSFYRNGDFLV